MFRYRWKIAFAAMAMLAMCIILTGPAFAQTPVPTPAPAPAPAVPDGGLLTWTLAQWGDFFKALTAFLVAAVGILTPLWLSIRGTLNRNTETQRVNTAVTQQNTVETVAVKQTVAENTLDRAQKSAVSYQILGAIAEKVEATVPVVAPPTQTFDPAMINAIADAIAARSAITINPAAPLPVPPA